MEKLKKRGFIQIAEWGIASFIIIFILLTFAIISSMLIFSKTVVNSLSPSEENFKQEGFVDIASEKSFENFMRLEFESNNKKFKIFDVVADAPNIIQDSEVIKKYTEKTSTFLSFVLADRYSSGWIKIFDVDSKEISAYSVVSGGCEVNSKNSAVYNIFFTNNQIVLCLEPK